MNKTLITTTLLLLFSIQSLAQARNYNSTFDAKMWMGIPVGLAFPVGDFASDDLENANADLARLGFNGKIDLGVRVYQHIGFCASIATGQNSFKEEAIKNVLPRTSSVAVEVNATAWKYFGALGGLYLSAPIGANALMVKGQIGYALAKSPSLDIRATSGNAYARLNQESGSGEALLLSFGISTLFNINEMAYFTVGLDYMSTQPTFSHIEVTSISSSDPVAFDNISFKMNMSWVNLNIGICRKF